MYALYPKMVHLQEMMWYLTDGIRPATRPIHHLLEDKLAELDAMTHSSPEELAALDLDQVRATVATASCPNRRTGSNAGLRDKQTSASPRLDREKSCRTGLLRRKCPRPVFTRDELIEQPVAWRQLPRCRSAGLSIGRS